MIGIVTQPYAPESGEVELGGGTSGFVEGDFTGKPYVAASYVKFVEAAGALPAVVPHNATGQELHILLGRLNGVIFPGGGASLSPGHPYHDIGRQVLRYAVEANDRGDAFPVQFTCLGFELIMQLVAGDGADIFVDTDAMNWPSSLTLTSAGLGGKFFGADDAWGNGCGGPEIARLLAAKPLAMNSHHKGVSPGTFAKSSNLSSFFTVVATDVDRNGVPYVAMVEAKKYPFLATQFHPEKNAYEWAGDTPHTLDAVRVTAHFAQVLGREVRRSQHTFPDNEALNAALIYNESPLFMAKYGGYFEQAYFMH